MKLNWNFLGGGGGGWLGVGGTFHGGLVWILSGTAQSKFTGHLLLATTL